MFDFYLFFFFLGVFIYYVGYNVVGVIEFRVSGKFLF